MAYTFLFVLWRTSCTSPNAPLPITLIIVKSEARIRKFETASQMVLSANISKCIMYRYAQRLDKINSRMGWAIIKYYGIYLHRVTNDSTFFIFLMAGWSQSSTTDCTASNKQSTLITERGSLICDSSSLSRCRRFSSGKHSDIFLLQKISLYN